MCGNLLQIEPAASGRRLRFFCPTCPYVCPVTNKVAPFPHHLLSHFSFVITLSMLALCLLIGVDPLSCFSSTVQIVKKQHLAKKELETIFSGADAMKFAPKTASMSSLSPFCYHLLILLGSRFFWNPLKQKQNKTKKKRIFKSKRKRKTEIRDESQ